MIIAEKLHIMFRDKEIFHVKNHKGENESMQDQTRTPVFQNSDGTWGHLTKTINPLICTIEYGSSTRFSSKEEAEKADLYHVIGKEIDDEYIKTLKNLVLNLDTIKRVLEYWNSDIKPEIESGKRVIIVAHGNSLRGLIKYLDNISDKDIIKLELETGNPICYELDENLKPIRHYYLK